MNAQPTDSNAPTHADHQRTSLHSVDEALAIVCGTGIRYPIETVSLSEAMGRCLAQDVPAERDMPPFDRVTMDGIAIAHAAYAQGTRSFRLLATQAAGAAPLRAETPQDAIRVMTGAVLPAGTDCVVPQEEITIEGNTVTILETAAPAPWLHVHRQGSDKKQGECMLAAGTRVRSNEVSVIASSGLATVSVRRAPSVAIVSTGDELVDVGRPILPHQIRMTTHHSLSAALRKLGVGRVSTFHIPDDFTQVCNTLAALLGRYDLLLTLGGISKGEFDYVGRALEALQIQPMVYGVSQRPGKPLWFGVHEQRAVFGLPGNPLSTLVCLHKYVRPFLELAMGGKPSVPVPALLEEDIDFEPPLSFFPPVRARQTETGQWSVLPARYNTSGNIAALAQTDGFIELPAGQSHFPAGSLAPFSRWL